MSATECRSRLSSLFLRQAFGGLVKSLAGAISPESFGWAMPTTVQYMYVGWALPTALPTALPALYIWISTPYILNERWALPTGVVKSS